MHACFFCAIAGSSTLAEFMFFGPSTVMMVVFIACWAVCGLLIVPAIMLLPWMNDTEDELTKRGVAIPGGMSLERRFQRYAMKLMLWFAAILFVVWLLHQIR